MADESKTNSIDVWAAVQQMKSTKGWAFLMERYAKEGDELLTKILNTFTDTRARELYVYQLEALGKISKILEQFELEARSEQARQKEPSHIGK